MGKVVTSTNKDFLLDIVGRYTVTIGGKSYDTVCVMDIETCDCGVVSDQLLDMDGKTILWRRYNRNDWAFDRYKTLERATARKRQTYRKWHNLRSLVRLHYRSYCLKYEIFCFLRGALLYRSKTPHVRSGSQTFRTATSRVVSCHNFPHKGITLCAAMRLIPQKTSA